MRGPTTGILLVACCAGLGCIDDAVKDGDVLGLRQAIAGDSHARQRLEGLGAEAVRARELRTHTIPTSLHGRLPQPSKLTALLVDCAAELDVARAVETRVAPVLDVDASSGESLLILDCSFAEDEVFEKIEVHTDVDAGFIDVKVILSPTRSEHPARGLPLRLIRRNLVIRRHGLGVRVSVAVLRGDGEAGTSTCVLEATGGGLSPLDRHPSPGNLAAAVRIKDCLAIRRFLREKLRLRKCDVDGLARFLTATDPFTAYWAARAMAAKGDFRTLRTAVKAQGRTHGLDDYVVSAVYQAIGRDVSREAREFLLDADLFRQVDSPKVGRPRRQWLAPLIGKLLSTDEKSGLLQRLEQGKGSAAEILHAADIMIWSGDAGTVGATVALLDNAKASLREELFNRLSSRIRPPGLRQVRAMAHDKPDDVRSAIRKHRRLPTAWADNPEAIKEWWERNGHRATWDPDRRMYVIKEE